MGKRLYGIRGAIRCLNQNADIERRVSELYDELLSINGLGEVDIVSLIFSVTPDLTALNPAAALRRTGRGGELALFSTAESGSDDGLTRVVRVLVHAYLEEGSKARHAYLNGAEVLRPDRTVG